MLENTFCKNCMDDISVDIDCDVMWVKLCTALDEHLSFTWKNFSDFLQYDVTQFHWCLCVLSLTLFLQIIINQQNAANIKHGYQYQCHHNNILPFTGLLLSSELHTNDAITTKTTLARYMLPPSDPGESVLVFIWCSPLYKSSTWVLHYVVTVMCIVLNEGPGVALYSANTDRHLRYTFRNIFVIGNWKLIFNWFDTNCSQPSCECKEVN